MARSADSWSVLLESPFCTVVSCYGPLETRLSLTLTFELPPEREAALQSLGQASV